MAEDVGSEPTPRLTFRERGYFLVGSDAIEGWGQLLDGAVPIALGDFSGPVRFPLPRALSLRKTTPSNPAARQRPPKETTVCWRQIYGDADEDGGNF